MTMRTILAAYDASESSRAAFDFALDLARCTGSELRVLAVVRPPDFAEEVETEDLIERGRENMQKAIEEPLAKAASVGVTCSMNVVVGRPAEQIVMYAETNGIDHIVVGHRGHTFFERWLIGSVARQVIAYAPCAVTVVRPARTTTHGR
jgi:nucleotide-binding universal stress UspA family protein